MDTGHVISGVGHVALIGWVLFGGVFSSRPEPIEVREVAVISGAEFDAMTKTEVPPEVITDVAVPAAPEATPDAPEVSAAPETPVEEAPPPVPEAPAEETPPVVDETPVTPVVPEDVTEAPEPPADVSVDVPEEADRPVERPADRVAPEAVAPTEPDVVEDTVETPAVVPEDTGETVQDPQEQTAPPEATDRTVTEADLASRSAPTSSPRPPARRPDAPRPEVTEAPEPVVDVPVNDAAESGVGETDDAAVQAALEAALSSVENDVPQGPPLTSGETDSLRRAVQQCWNIDQGAQSARIILTIAFSLSQQGQVVDGSLRMIENSGGDSGAVDAAFQTARRAILRCQKSGYDMPVEKYGQWKDIEMTFNPERMQIR
ncbi:energy transducer TonB [Sulfitobacter sp. SK012]|uniref:energy transducer TonB n=1 Tax=Sulfitobacter sp. SK012 TaxID=1389005 RepID=UPI000E0C0FE4|nr:energy transducer TonB [Sulfitobacter sp. SK012]AXI45695.1 energy transducer TonB [Sulfitobacter sp. SK012]